jgi:hypothetical protein
VQQYRANVIVPRARLTPAQLAERDACTAKLAAKRDAVVAQYLAGAIAASSGCGDDPLIASGALNAGGTPNAPTTFDPSTQPEPGTTPAPNQTPATPPSTAQTPPSSLRDALRAAPNDAAATTSTPTTTGG